NAPDNLLRAQLHKRPYSHAGQKPMRKSLIFSLTFTSLFVFCAGCNDTAARQQAEQARRQQTANDLKELGKAMHNKQGSESSIDSAVTDAPENTSDSPPTNVDSSK